jgi:hypothetical protein
LGDEVIKEDAGIDGKIFDQGVPAKHAQQGPRAPIPTMNKFRMVMIFVMLEGSFPWSG